MGTSQAVRPTTFAEAENVLAEKLPRYEKREHQQRYAAAIEDAIAHKTNFLGEAGPGTGKSLGYLIPAILSGKRVVITTATKALQDQLIDKDLPFLQENLGVPFSYALLKGRKNYACRARLSSADPKEFENLGGLLESDAREDFDGQRANLGFKVSNEDWNKATVSSEECPGKSDCPFGNVCHAEKAKEKAKGAKILVVNHALFFTDLMVKEENPFANMIGEYDYFIADEAHELEDWVTSACEARFTAASIRTFANEIFNFCGRYADPEALHSEEILEGVQGALDELHGQSQIFWAELPEAGRIRSGDIVKKASFYEGLSRAISGVRIAFAKVEFDEEDRKASIRFGILCRRARKLEERFINLISAKDLDLVRWIEEDTFKGKTYKILKSAPVHVDDILRKLLFSKKQGILCSATISVGGTFNFIAGRLGIDTYTSIDVGSPFDFPNQARLYVPPTLPDPAGPSRGRWQSDAIDEIEELVKVSKGRALVLFTSVSDMKETYLQLADKLPFKCLVQGEGTNQDLVAEFKSDNASVLFATKSFFTGIDIQGDALSLLILAKLPFNVPTEPVTQARIEAKQAEIRARGNVKEDLVGYFAFVEYQVPLMSLVLKQGFGRLIRHREDTGVVSILDPRLLTKKYGKTIVRSLPDAPVVTERAEVERFFKETAA